MRRRQPANLLVLGASGSVAQAFLRRLSGQRSHFGKLLLLDKNQRVCRSRHLDHDRLDYRFIRRRLRFPADQPYYTRLLRRQAIDLVLDLSNLDTLPVLSATDQAGVSYLNTSLNDEQLDVRELAQRLHPTRHQPRRAPHILCTGMNPGVVNLWVRHGMAQFGTPTEIVHFEYDDSMTIDRWRPVVTWSKREFLAETTWNRTGVYAGRRTQMKRSNAIENRVSLRSLMAPVLPAAKYPEGFLVLHEENLTLGRATKVPSKFIYAIHPRTMDYLVSRYQRRGNLRERDLELGDNIQHRLTGSDLVAVCLKYPRQRVYYMNRAHNSDLVGTNATCAQVAVGIFSGLFTLMTEKLPPRVYFVGDLYDTNYRQLVFGNMPVEMHVCRRRKGRWVLRESVSKVRLRRNRPEQRMVI